MTKGKSPGYITSIAENVHCNATYLFDTCFCKHLTIVLCL
jgi:hypothetical protein